MVKLLEWTKLKNKSNLEMAKLCLLEISKKEYSEMLSDFKWLKDSEIIPKELKKVVRYSLRIGPLNLKPASSTVRGIFCLLELSPSVEVSKNNSVILLVLCRGTHTIIISGKCSRIPVWRVYSKLKFLYSCLLNLTKENKAEE